MKKWLLFALCAFACGSLQAATIRLLNGEVLEGILDLGPRGLSISNGGGAAKPVELAAILEVRCRGTPGSADTLPPGVVLSSGSVIAERNLLAMDEAAITVGIERVQVPTAAIAWLLFNPVAQSRLNAAPGGQPGGLLEGGDFFPGTFAGFKGGRAMINSLLFGLQSFTPRQQVEAVCLREWKPPLARFVATTIQGSRLVTDELRFEAGAVTVKDTVLGVFRIKFELLESLRAGPGRYQALAEQKPLKVETRPGTDAAATWQVQKGLADALDAVTMAPNLAVSFAVPPEFTTFTSGLSVPKTANANYRVAFAIYGDGRALHRSPLVSSADKPLPVRIDVRGIRVVTLRVEPFGQAMGGGDWLAPMLLR